MILGPGPKGASRVNFGPWGSALEAGQAVALANPQDNNSEPLPSGDQPH